MIDTKSRWTKHEETLPRDTRSGSEIINQERINKFDRHDAKKNIAVSDDMAEKNRFQRKAVERQRQTEGTRNRFGDKVIVDASEKLEPTAGKRTAATEWHGKPIQRSNSGRPLDAELIKLKEAAEADRLKRAHANERAKLGLPAAEEKPRLTAEEVQALCLFLAAAHTDWPLDERRGPNDGSEADQRYRAAVIHNAHQLRKMWDWLLLKNLAKLELAGMLMAFDQLKQGGFLDNGQPRKRGLGNDELINVVAEPPQSPLFEALGAKSQNAVDEVFALVKSGRARLERQRPATSEESQEIVAARKMNFNDLKHQVQQNYRKGN